MPLRFHPYPSLSYSDVSRIAKELHEVVSDDDLKRYADVVLQEREKGRSIRLQLLCEDYPYVIEVFDSEREGKTRFCFLVYQGPDKKNEIGLLEVDGLRCVTRAELI